MNDENRTGEKELNMHSGPQEEFMREPVKQREIPPTGILKPWVAELGLRYQGVLMGIIRGCDGAPRECPSKGLVRAIRGVLLHTHCADETNSASFIECCEYNATQNRMNDFVHGWDHLPLHFVMHLMFAVEIIGYCHPEPTTNALWRGFYMRICKKLHVTPEFPEELKARLGAEETEFMEAQK